MGVFLKYKIRKFTIQFSKNLIKAENKDRKFLENKDRKFLENQLKNFEEHLTGFQTN